MLFALRYIDDLLSFIAYDITKPQTKLFAQYILSKLQKSYHKNMKLKPENFDNNKTKFLETEIIYQPQNDNTIHTKHHDKNTQQLLKNRTLKKVKTIHATSFGPKHQPTDIILNTLHRIYTNCSSKKLLFKSTLEYFYSQTFIGYKYQHFKKALYHISNSTNKLIWKKFLKKFKTQYKKSRSFRTLFGSHKLTPYYKL